MIARIIPLVVAAVLSTAISSRGQESVCDLFSHLKGADAHQVALSGDLIISKDKAVLGAADCDNQYRAPLSDKSNFFHLWPIALSLHPSPSVTPAQLQQFDDAAAEADRLRQAGKTVSASATFSGRLHLEASDGSPGELIFDSFKNLRIEALPDAGTLPVIPICDLFQNLPAWRGKRIAVRGEFVATMEGAWISGRCEGGFVTDGYRWPVSLWYAIPAYYASQTAYLYAPKWPPRPLDDGRLGQQSHVTTTGTFIGLLRMRAEYTIWRLPNGYTMGSGFGHLNGAAAELIVESVLSVESRSSQ